MKIKELTKSEETKRKYKKYSILGSYICEKGENKIDVSKVTYDRYKVCAYKDEEPREIYSRKEEKNIVFEAEKKGEYILYGRDINRLLGLIIALIFIFMMLIGRAAYSNIPVFKDTVDTIYDKVTGQDTPSAPTIEKTSETWAKENLVKVKKNAEVREGIKYYEYCIRDDSNFTKCNWERTETKSVLITENGTHYVAFRGISKKNKKGHISNIEKVLIDNENPEVESITVTGNKVEVKAEDRYSGIDKIEYKVGNGEYKTTNGTFELPNGYYKLTIRVVDNTGNIIEVEKMVNINVEGNETTENNPGNGETNPEQANGEENPENPENENGEENKEETNPEEPVVYEPPKIDLDEVPTTFERGAEYVLPSHYEFDELGGEVSCKLDLTTEITNTSEIPVGTHLISCKAMGNNGLTTSVQKEVEVTQGRNLGILDGWITMNLYYPEDATDLEWRIKDPTVLRTGYQADTWMPYTGPITVKLSDVENVYIRYKINGKTVIVAPNGKLVVDIEPASYTLKDGETPKVIIYYEDGAQTKEYRIDNGDWQTYEGEFNVGPNTKIEARVIKDVNVYDSNGDFVYTTKKQNTDAVFISEYIPETSQPSGGSPSTPRTTPTGTEYIYEPQSDGTWTSKPSGTTRKPSTYLEGPIITSNPSDTIVESTMVSVTPQQPADKIYISVDWGKFVEYTEPISVDKNCTIRAYYIRLSDGKKSDTTYYDVDNIYVPTLPYVKITASPSNYLSEDVSSVEVTISGDNYDRLEYGFNGNDYLPYEGPITITTSKTIYARGINANGDTVVSKTIKTIKPSIPQEELDVSIHFNPEKEQVQGLINKAQVTIDYDAKAEKKYYRIGWWGTTREYTGPFEITENDTIYAWATATNAYGEAEKGVSYLTTGIAAPKISLDTTEPASIIGVTIEYAPTADSMKYKIDNGPWIDYGGIFYVEENCTIYAKNSDVLGNENQSSRRIKNIAYVPNYTLLDKGSYFLLKLNYPSSSDKSTREYKWTPNGTWKT